LKYILGFLLFLSAIGLSIYGFKSHIEKQKEYIKRALTTPPNLSIETILGKNLPTQKIVDDDSLLGIDNNHNEIRDDIELKIFAAFKTPHTKSYIPSIFSRRTKNVDGSLSHQKCKNLGESY